MSSLAIVERKPPLNGGGCAGGVLFHLLDWHRRLARKRRLFSPRRLLPSSLRAAASPRARLPSPPTPALPLPPSPRPAGTAAHGAAAAAPGVVARLMGLEYWPSGGAPRPQKQRKVEAWGPDDEDPSAAVVLVLPTTRRRPPAAPEPAPPSARSHHATDLPARSPRRTRLVHAAATKLLEPGARASSRLALAYACSSPQHRREEGHSTDDFLSRSDSLSLGRSTRLQPPILPLPEAERDDGAAVSARRRFDHSGGNADAGSGTSTIVLPRMDFGDRRNLSRFSSDADAATRKENRVRSEAMNTCARVRSSMGAVRTEDERLLRKRGTPTRSEVSGSFDSGGLAGSARSVGRVREMASAGRIVAHTGSGPRRESPGSIARQGSIPGRDAMNRSGSAAASRISSNGSGQKRVSRKVGRDRAANNRDDRNTAASTSRSSVKSVARASSHSNLSKSRCPSRRAPDTTCPQAPAADRKCTEASASVVATSEKDEFRRLLKAKIDELGMSDRIEFTSSDAASGNLTAPVLQELISALTNDNTPTSGSSNYSDPSAPLSSNGNVGCSDQSVYAFPNDQSPDFQKCYQGDHDVDSSAASMNNEPNQPSPTSVLEACFSNDTSSLGSPVEKNEAKDLFVSLENKMEDLFNLDSDIVDLAMSVDTRKGGADEISHGNGKLSCVQNFVAHGFKFLESRLHGIGEAISNAELLLGSSLLHSTASGSPALHPFIMEMLENTMDFFGGEKSLDLTEEKMYQRTNFLFDCIVESLDSKFCNFGKCGYKAWLKLPLSLSKNQLKQELLEGISSWSESGGTARSRVADKELDLVTTSWDACQVEAFDINVTIENDILEALVVELAFDLW